MDMRISPSIRRAKIVVNAGDFRASEAAAVAMYAALMSQRDNKSEMTIYRGVADRRCLNSKSVFVIGTGGDSSVGRSNFDPEGVAPRECGLPYSAAGLFWDAYGVEISDDNEIAQYVDRRFVRPIDAADNGIVPECDMPYIGLCDAIGMMNQDCQNAQGRLFCNAVNMCINVLLGVMRLGEENLRARDVIFDSATADCGTVLFIDEKFHSWKEHVAKRDDYDKLLYVTFPSTNVYEVWRLPEMEFISSVPTYRDALRACAADRRQKS